MRRVYALAIILLLCMSWVAILGLASSVAVTPPSYSLAWSRQLDPFDAYVLGVSTYVHVATASGHLYVLTDTGTLVYSSPSYAFLKSQYGVLRLELPHTSASNQDGSVTAWVTSAKWLHILVVVKGVPTYISISLPDVPTSVGMDDNYIIVGTHSGLLLAYH